MIKLMKIKNPSIYVLMLIGMAMSGCSIFPNNSLPTPWPTNYLPTAIVLTMDAISLTNQSAFFVETLIIPDLEIPETTTITESEIDNTQQSATPTPKIQKTPSQPSTPTYPEAVIQIVSPGTLSKVISPIEMIAYAQPGADNKIFIDLIGENGQVIASEMRLSKENLPRLWAPVNMEISFQLDKAAEYARLQIRTEDQFHRTIALSPVHLILQSDGMNKIYTNTILFDRCIVYTPRANEVISGGLLNIDGEFLPFNGQPIQVELITESGLVVSSKSIQLQPESSDRFIPFKIDLQFDVDKNTPVRLTIYQKDERIPGNLYVFSQLLILSP